MKRNRQACRNGRVRASHVVLGVGLAVAASLSFSPLLSPATDSVDDGPPPGIHEQRSRQISAQPRVVTRPIESIRVGDRVLARNPQIENVERHRWIAADTSEWIHLSLEMPISGEGDARPDACTLRIELLRPEAWFREHSEFISVDASALSAVSKTETEFGLALSEDEVASHPESSAAPPRPPRDSDSVGLTPLRPVYRDLLELEAELERFGHHLLGIKVELSLPEMGAVGAAYVRDLKPCPPIASGDGQIVTATFAHPPSRQVLDARFEGESEPIGVTDNHLFWSEDRNDFVPIGQMSPGERVRTVFGETKRLVSVLPRPGPQTVYNLEVYGEHVYFVGSTGILAHNSYGWSRAHRSRLNKQLKAAGVTNANERRWILNQIRDNFTDYANVKITRTARPRAFWRRWGGTNADGSAGRALRRGAYGTRGPRTKDFTRENLAVIPDWKGGDLSRMTRWTIKKGSVIIEGATGPQASRLLGRTVPGGGQQILVPGARDGALIKPRTVE